MKTPFSSATAAAFVLAALATPQAGALTIQFVGAYAGSVQASIPRSTWAAHSQLNASGAQTGPAQGSFVEGTPWTGYEAGRVVGVRERFDFYAGHGLAETRFAAADAGPVDAHSVHQIRLLTEVANWDGCCGMFADASADVWFRFSIPGATGPISDATGRVINAPYPIYFAYEWTANATASPHAWNWDTTFRASGAAPDAGGDYAWTAPTLPRQVSDLAGSFSGGRYGVFYSWAGGDYRFRFSTSMVGGALWGEPSMADFTIRLAFSETPITAVPQVPEPGTGALWLAGLAVLLGTGWRRGLGRARPAGSGDAT